FFEDFIKLTDDHEGFISFMGFFIEIVILGILGWTWRKFITKPILISHAIGSSYPDRLTLEFENISDKKLVVYGIEAEINTGEKYYTNAVFPIIIDINKQPIAFGSNINGKNQNRKYVDITLNIGLLGMKKYIKKFKHSIDSDRDFKKTEKIIVQ
ncbi:hypothetical protein KJ766_04105, partial [Patescibacteria group bacterium]|nr:hypothetical protein [Patescibacteria group bacterium]